MRQRRARTQDAGAAAKRRPRPGLGCRVGRASAGRRSAPSDAAIRLPRCQRAADRYTRNSRPRPGQTTASRRPWPQEQSVHVGVPRLGRVRTARVVMHRGLRKHGIVLDLGFAQRRAVARDEDELGCASKGAAASVRHRGRKRGRVADSTQRRNVAQARSGVFSSRKRGGHACRGAR